MYEIGHTISHYRIVEQLGQGGMGEVYKAFDEKLKRAVAIKRLRPEIAADSEHRQRFLKEAQHAAGINHQGVAGIHDILEQDGELLLVMEYVEGRTLQDLRLKPVSIESFALIARQCLEALQAAHEHGVVHRDLKPSNIMLTSSRQVKLLDFGLARRVSPGAETTADSVLLTQPGTVPGTLAYMAPEVLRGNPADHRSDIFSMGVVFYEMLTGRHPFMDATAPATAHRIFSTRPEVPSASNPEVTPALDLVVGRMLEKDPVLRYASARDVLDDLRELRQAAKSAVSGVVATVPKPARLGRLWKLGTLPLAAALLLIASPRVRETLLSGWRSPSLPAHPTLVVLPLASGGGMAQFAAFAGGMTEELGQHLSEAATHRPFSVVPCSLASARDVTEVGAVGKQLGADFALTGQLTARETDVRVDLALVDAKTGRRLRGTVFAGPLSDPMTLDFLMTEKSLGLLGFELEPRERRELAVFGTSDPVAYQRYLEGLGRLYYSRDSDHPTAAVESFREALALDSDFAQARTEIGNAHLAAYEQSGSPGELQAALSDCLASSRQKPELPGAQSCLGRSYLLTGDLVSAVGCFERARFLSASDLTVLEDLAVAYEASGRKEDAERVYAEAVRQKPEYWRGHSNLGAFYFQQSRFQEAETEFSKVVQLAPLYYRAYSNLCGVYGELFQWQQMQHACEQSLQIREQGGAYTNLASAYFYQHRFSAAVEVARKALIFMERNDPQSQSYIDYGNLAEVLYWSPGERDKAAGPYRKAIEGAERYLRSNARDVATLGRIALYHAMLGDKTAALEYLNRSLAIDPANPETLFKAGVIYKQFGDAERALKCLSEAVAKGLKTEKIALHPIFEDLNPVPKFRALVGRQ